MRRSARFNTHIFLILVVYVYLEVRCSNASVEDSSIACRPLWIRMPDTSLCYLLVTKPLDCTAASDKCREDQAQLVSIHSEAEKEFLINITKSGKTTVDRLHIGLFRMAQNRWQDQQWQWEDANHFQLPHESFLEWAPDNPTQNSNQRCAVLLTDSGTLEDRETNFLAQYVCKYHEASLDQLRDKVIQSCSSSLAIGAVLAVLVCLVLFSLIAGLFWSRRRQHSHHRSERIQGRNVRSGIGSGSKTGSRKPVKPVPESIDHCSSAPAECAEMLHKIYDRDDNVEP